MRFKAIQTWLVAATEFEPALLGGRELERLVEQRMLERAPGGEEAYLTLLQKDTTELGRVLAGVAVPETSFFRYPASYDALRPWLATRDAAGASELRMLSLACATGEEPCSMAMTAARAGWDLARVRIDAVDRNPHVIEHARRGRYAAIGRETPGWARVFFETSGDQAAIVPAVRRAITYRHASALDLTVPTPAYDVIFCRNLLIYLGASARRTLVAWLARALADEGRLFLGHAEGGVGRDGRFRPASPANAFAFAVGPPEDDRLPDVRVKWSMPRARPAATRRTPTTAGNGEPPPPPAAPAGATLGEARALADRGELSAAEDMTRSVLEDAGPTLDGYELLGSIHLASGALQDAHDCFFRAIYLEPEHHPSLLQLALICERLGDAEQAMRYRQRADRARSKASHP